MFSVKLAICLLFLQLSAFSSETVQESSESPIVLITGYDDQRMSEDASAHVTDEAMEVMDDLFSQIAQDKGLNPSEAVKPLKLQATSKSSTPKSVNLAKKAEVAMLAYAAMTGNGYQASNYKIPAPYCQNENTIYCNPYYPYRSLNGSCNNLQYRWWGQKEGPYKRLLKPTFDDGYSSPRTQSVVKGYDLPNPRTVAMNVHYPQNTPPSEWSQLFTFFGQFVIHDMALTAASTYGDGSGKVCSCNTDDSDCFNIPVPYEDYYNKNQQCLSFTRSSPSTIDFNCNLGPRENLNLVTTWLDMSNVYGSSVAESSKLRAYKQGLLRSANGGYNGKEVLPFENPAVGCKYTRGTPNRCRITGDVRGEDSNYLSSIHTLFLREHNRVARALSYINPYWNDERLFQEARRIVTAEYQHIVYTQLVPGFTGYEIAAQYDILPSKKGYTYSYNSYVYPNIPNEFATAGFRCHNLVQNWQKEADINCNFVSNKTVNAWIFNQDATPYPEGILRGQVCDYTPYAKNQVNDIFSNWLFNGYKQWFGSDKSSLPALNIQRGRDHGIPGYNYFRQLCGLNYAKNFDELTNIPPYILAELKKLYYDVNDIDLWTGMVSEYPLKGASAGPTRACIIAKTFSDLKHGDRFYYEHGQDQITRFTSAQLDNIRQTSLSRILCENMDFAYIQADPLLNAQPKYNPYVDCGKFSRLNLNLWKDSYGNAQSSYNSGNSYNQGQSYGNGQSSYNQGQSYGNSYAQGSYAQGQSYANGQRGYNQGQQSYGNGQSNYNQRQQSYGNGQSDYNQGQSYGNEDK